MIGGRIIREARLRAGLTQHALARRLGTSQSVVARWETGRRAPTMETVVRAVRSSGLDLIVSLVPGDDDHQRLIADALARTPAERIEHLRALGDLEHLLHTAGRGR
jgi:transcriptional regulator with XRE-family HTH domain